MSADGKYSLSDIWNLHQLIQMLLSKKKHFLTFFSIFEICIKFSSFWKNRWLSYPMYFQNYRLWITWLHKCLNSLVSENPSTVNMPKPAKLFSSQHDNFFIIFFYYSKSDWLPKFLCWGYFNPKDILLKSWVLMISMISSGK